MKEVLIHLAYIISAILFIYGLKNLSKVRSARRGNLCPDTPKASVFCRRLRPAQLWETQ